MYQEEDEKTKQAGPLTIDIPLDGPMPPARLLELIDVLAGTNEIPKYQYFDVGRRCEITHDEVRELEEMFFAGFQHDPHDIKIINDSGFDRHLLLIRNGLCRAVSLSISGERWPLARAYHYTADGAERGICLGRGAV